jgi:hypothetical protein
MDYTILYEKYKNRLIIMNYENIKQSMIESVETSVNGLKLFPNLENASYNHIFNSTVRMFLLTECQNLNNFNPARLSSNPYPINNRPRGQQDIDSLNYHRTIIKQNGNTEPIWIYLKNDEYTLLDGAHRIVASYLENKLSIPAFIIKIE